MARLAFLWGYCEATWFFVVPDVGLTFAALLGFRRSLRAVLACLAGSMLGAVTIYLFSRMDWPVLWSCLPGFKPAMLTVAEEQLQARGASAVMLGPEAGIAYRFYVFLAARSGVGLVSLLAWTPFARLLRMLLMMGTGERLPLRIHLFSWGIFWVLVYAGYWGLFLDARYSEFSWFADGRGVVARFCVARQKLSVNF